MVSLLKRFKRKKKKDTDPTAQEFCVETLRTRLPDATSFELQTIIDVQPFTMTSPERILGLCRAVEYLQNNEVAGDFVECGVWRGGSMSAVVRTLQNVHGPARDLWLYDTFEGMTPPTNRDVDFLGQTAEQLLDQQDPLDPMSVWCVSPLSGVRQLMTAGGYPADRIHFVQGKVEETLAKTLPGKIALLRLDTDWYESTKCELEHLFPKLVPGAVVIIDDYGHWKGCRRAVDEYFANHGIEMLLNRLDYTGRIGVYYPSSKDRSAGS